MLKIKFLFALFVALYSLSACQSTPLHSSSKDLNKVIEVTVDQTGYHPKKLNVPKGTKSVTLRFNRVTDQTCAREVINEEQSINKKLPLNEPVDITFDLKDKDLVTYGCHMDKMHEGTINKK